jgi:hypothetical protein
MLNCLSNAMLVNLFSDYLQWRHTIANHGEMSFHFNLVNFQFLLAGAAYSCYAW